MIKGKRILGVITARGGSKSIPKKNIVNLNGRPLIAYAIKAIRESKLVDEKIVSTDDLEITKTALKYGAKVPFLRPKPLATDTAKSVDVLIHALREMERINRQKYDYILCLQPTNPFITGKDIDAAIKLMVKKRGDSAASVYCLDDFHPAKIKIIKNGWLTDYLMKEESGQRRQDYPGVYKRNGGIFLTKREILFKRRVLGKKIAPYLMPAERSLDINNYFDLELAGFFLKKIKNAP